MSTLQVLEVTNAVTQDYRTLLEVSLFLMQPTAPSAALGLYISVGGTEWQYRGFVSNSHPSGETCAGTAYLWPDSPLPVLPV